MRSLFGARAKTIPELVDVMVDIVHGDPDVPAVSCSLTFSHISG